MFPGSTGLLGSHGDEWYHGKYVFLTQSLVCLSSTKTKPPPILKKSKGNFLAFVLILG